MKRFFIIHNSDATSNEIATQIIEKLSDYKYVYDEKSPDLIIVVGGDGKFLRTVHQYLERIEAVKFVVINTGTLGFTSDFEADEVDLLVDSIAENVYKVEEYSLIKVEVIKNDGEVVTEYALNEFRIENPMRTLIVDLHIDGEYFEEFSGNGLCVSTQFGSTAYNRSLGGAIVAQGVEIMQLAEIAGIHNNKYSSLSNPLIVSSQSTIKITPKEIKNVILGIDFIHLELEGYKQINITLSGKKLKFARYRNYSYYERLHHSFIV